MKIFRINLWAMFLWFWAASISWCFVDLPVAYIKQPDGQTCLPTCLTMALHYKGKCELTTDTIYMLHKETRYNRYNLPKIVSRYGLYALPCWYELGWNAQTLKEELDAGNPIITGCDVGRSGHFVLIIGYTDDGRWIIHDPTSKWQGYALGGKHNIVPWEAFNWRGGVFIHDKPFPEPKISGRVIRVSAPSIMRPAEIAEVKISIRNNGSQPWQSPIFLESVEPSFTSFIRRESPFFFEGTWANRSRVLKAPALQPGETAEMAFKIQAPQIAQAASFREFYNLLTEEGKPLSFEPVSGPGIFEMSPKILVEPKFPKPLPFAETLKDGMPSPFWSVKFGSLNLDSSTTKPKALRLLANNQHYNAAWVGDSSWSDYTAECMVYCDYRPELKAKGWDRVGLFVRDNGDHAADRNNYFESGEFYCMTYDSDDGRIRAGNVMNGGIDDFHPKPFIYLKKSGWHKFAIKCKGETIAYELDDTPFHTEKDDLRTTGSCGIFYKTNFEDRMLTHGALFAEFRCNQ
ncbi:MAG TPA: C39 family peptidase [Candidatus Sumerlaeota bacterium]|nr:MAG: hypothetical protein BWY12_00775 [candidate division BRC1 bacterium ADurb.Bin183]HOE63207.1 C39 family peptidase [Candidatus Sumerlaeota bacterium]HRR30889.1 C39 family peptidase [Candidatus Sumerlaeia bacterium]HON50565.1 C39 family peptidase [Candidatus Sumerlaeota bacterium]HOR65387.1 C39 family peptidase [Candidatus Sumerlaeota bacterium]